jgi:hypothetical protein
MRGKGMIWGKRFICTSESAVFLCSKTAAAPTLAAQLAFSTLFGRRRTCHRRPRRQAPPKAPTESLRMDYAALFVYGLSAARCSLFWHAWQHVDGLSEFEKLTFQDIELFSQLIECWNWVHVRYIIVRNKTVRRYGAFTPYGT